MGLNAWQKRAKSLEVKVQKRAKIAEQRVRRFKRSDAWSGEYTPAMEKAIATNPEYGLHFGNVRDLKKKYGNEPKRYAKELQAELNRIESYNQSVTGSAQGYKRYMTRLYRNVTQNKRATFKEAMNDRERSIEIVEFAKELFWEQQHGHGVEGVQFLTLGSPPESKNNFMYVVRSVSKDEEWNTLDRTTKYEKVKQYLKENYHEL